MSGLRSIGIVLSCAALRAGEIDDRWMDLPALPVARQEVAVAALHGKVYVIGGIRSSRAATGRVSRYDVEAGVWENVDPLPDNTQLHHIGAAAVGGKIFAVGGLNGSFRGVDSVFAYDPTVEVWSRVASLNRARGSMGVAAVDGRIYAVGGQSGSTSFRDTEVYDPQEDRWTVLDPLPTARNHLAAVALDGQVWAIAGRADGLRDALECFDPVTSAWTVRAPIPTARGGIAAAAIFGKIFVFGGEGNSAASSGVFPQVEAYDPNTNTWESRPDMANPRHGIGAATVGGQVFIPGGAPVQGFGTTDHHDVFVPAEANEVEPLFRRGDANLDTVIDISDPVFVLFVLFTGGGAFPCSDAADANDDGANDITDAVVILDFLFRLGSAPPPPGPFEAGADPSDDELDCTASE